MKSGELLGLFISILVIGFLFLMAMWYAPAEFGLRVFCMVLGGVYVLYEAFRVFLAYMGLRGLEKKVG